MHLFPRKMTLPAVVHYSQDSGPTSLSNFLPERY